MKTPQNQSSQKLSLSPKLATALGVAVVASQADAAVQAVPPADLPGAAIQGNETLLILSSSVLQLGHSQFFTSTFYPGYWNGSTFTGSWSYSTFNRKGIVSASKFGLLGSARRAADLFTVKPSVFGSVNALSRGTSLGSTWTNPSSNNLVPSSDNYIPVKFKLGGTINTFGLAQVEFNENGEGYVKLLNFWYSDNGSELEWNEKLYGAEPHEVTPIPEVGGMIPTALLLGMAALVRSRRKDPLAGSLAALAAGVGGLMARANSSEEAA